MHKSAMAKRTVSKAVLFPIRRHRHGTKRVERYTCGEYVYFPSFKLEFMLAHANIIWLTVYATLDTPAVCPSRLHQPWIQEKIAT